MGYITDINGVNLSDGGDRQGERDARGVGGALVDLEFIG